MRFHDWPERFAAFLASRERMPFAWGRRANDCGSFVGAGVSVVRGIDLMAPIPEYSSADEADLIVGENYAALLDPQLPRRRSPGLGQRADVALANYKERETLFLIEGQTLVGPGARGLMRIPRGHALIVWAV